MYLRALLFATSFLYSGTVSAVIVAWRAVQFAPHVDPQLFIRHFHKYLTPENEPSMYITGVSIVMIGSVVGWFFLHLLFRRMDEYTAFIRAGWCVRIGIASLFSIVAGLTFTPHVGSLQISAFFLLWSGVSAAAVYLLPKRMNAILARLTCNIDVIVAALVGGICFYTVVLLLFPSAVVRTFLISQFQSYYYVYVTTYQPLQWAMTCIVIIILLFLWYRTPQWLQQWSRMRIVRISLDASALLFTIAFVSTIIPWTKNMYGGFVSYEPVLGPVNDILGGKTLLVDAYSQYGLLFLYTLAGIFSFVPLTLDTFYWVNYIAVIAGYFILYVAMRLWTRSIALSFLALFLFALHHYFSHYQNALFYSQSTFLRFGWWTILLVFLLCKEKYQKISNFKFLRGIELLIVGAAVFWGMDTGAYTLAAYLAYLTVRSELRLPDLLKAYAWVTLILFLFLTVLTVFMKQRSGFWPDWGRYIAPVIEYSGGFDMVAMPAVGIAHGVIALYLCVLAGILFLLLMHVRLQPANTGLSIPAFVATYGVFQFMYYVGKSTNGNLHTVILPFLLLCLWLVSLSRTWVSFLSRLQRSTRYLLFSFGVALLLFVSLVTYVGMVNAYEVVVQRGPVSPGIDVAYGGPSYWQSVAAVNAYLGDTKAPNRRVAIFSLFDWSLHIHTHSVDVMDVSALLTYFRIAHIDALGKQVIERKPPVVFVDHGIGSRYELFLTMIDKDYRYRENVGQLDIWERR